MKVKELMQLLEGLNPEAELGIDGIYMEPKRFVWNKLVEQAYKPYSKSFEAKTVNELITNAEKTFKECKARKNSQEYKKALKCYENSKTICHAYVFKCIKETL